MNLKKELIKKVLNKTYKIENKKNIVIIKKIDYKF